MKLVSIHDLSNGMILGEDIMNNDGVIFLTRGVILTDRNIRSLGQFGIDFVYIMDGKETIEDTVQAALDTPEAKLNKEYNHTINSFKDLYHNVRLGKQVVIDEVEENIQPLLTDIMANNNILGSLRMIQISDEYTYMHSVNVGLISTMIGKWLGFSETDLGNLALAGFMHDLGKSKVPNEIINKPAKLTAEEFEIIKMHPVHGHEILTKSDNVNIDIMLGVLEHHERMDGKGYPNGTKGDGIHEFARIIAVADVFDALTSNRVYKSKLSPFRVAEMLMEEAVGHLDPMITQTFLRNIANFYVGNKVRLNNGEIGEVIMVNKFNFTRPLVKVKDKFFDLASNYHLEIIEVID